MGLSPELGTTPRMKVLEENKKPGILKKKSLKMTAKSSMQSSGHQ